MMTILLKRGLSKDRKKIIFEEGELVLELDTDLLYVGDGKTPGGNIIKNCYQLADRATNGNLRVGKDFNGVYVDNWEDLI